jgi:hypothetical protein
MLVASATLADSKDAAQKPKRARPPKWTPDVVDTFFPDARTKLVGSRPDYDKAAAATTAATKSSHDASAATGTDEATTATPSGSTWSKLIDAETIETEIKRLSQELAKTVTAPAQFKGGGYKDCRRQFTTLAALFAVIAEYDGDVRWRDAAPTIRDVFAKAGRNCKVGTDQSYQEAAQRKQNLADLVAGNRPKPSTAERKADWAQVADRPPLMQRLNIAQQDRIQKWLGNKKEFSARRDDIRHEAQLAATIAHIVTQNGYEYWDDETYAGYARELQASETDLATAAASDNYDQAQQAFARATKSCTACHEGYRQ